MSAPKPKIVKKDLVYTGPEERIPPTSDTEYWARVSQPILDFLVMPRDWKALRPFQRRNRWNQNLFNNCLAWLEMAGKIRNYTYKGVVTWAQLGCSSYDPVPYREPESPKKKGGSPAVQESPRQGNPLLEDLIQAGLIEVVP